MSNNGKPYHGSLAEYEHGKDNPTHQQTETIEDLIRFDTDTHDKDCGVTITRDLGNCDCNKSELIAALSAMLNQIIGDEWPQHCDLEYMKCDQCRNRMVLNGRIYEQRQLAAKLGFNIGGKE